MSGGRPTKYKPEMCAQVIELMEQGKSKEYVAAKLDLSRETLYQWCDPEGEYYIKEFSDTIKKGAVLCQLYWEEELQKATTGINQEANATLMIFNMKNRFRDQWSDMQVHEQRHSFVVSDEPVKDGDEWLSGHKPK